MFEQLQVEELIPLAPFTTFRIGGPARYFLRAHTKAEVLLALREAQAAELPVFILGGGSDSLVSDQGFPGLVIKMELNQFNITGQTLQAEAGVLINTAIRACVQQSLSGLEFAIGVPATIGGAVWANLGSRGSDISQVILAVQACDLIGNERRLEKTACQFSYRDSIFKHQPLVVLAAEFVLQSGDKTQLQKKMVELTQLKKQEQNVGEACAGCAFKNPAPDQPASKLIEQLGLKGYRIGGAQVSEQHANFIINTGTATADDVVQLISYIKQQVRDKTGVQLQEEIEYVG